MKRKSQRIDEPTPVYERIREILESARTTVSRSVNTTQVVANWLVGREIVEEEQRGQRRAGYGEKLIRTLSKQITAEFGRGYSVNNLEHFRDFYVTYPELIATPIPHALRGESETSSPPTASICHATRDASFQARAAAANGGSCTSDRSRQESAGPVELVEEA